MYEAQKYFCKIYTDYHTINKNRKDFLAVMGLLAHESR